MCERVLRDWCDAERLPLSELDLQGALVDDHLLVDLINAHKHTLTSLDLSNVEVRPGKLLLPFSVPSIVCSVCVL